ncbi:MAG TPA: ATP-binding protein [Methylomirabilota bacterium]|nr:ATP-binding protein [Methylomirabilota bacterium]
MTLLPRASLRTYLLTLTAAAVVPMLCFAAYLTIGLSRTQQEAVERGLIDTVAALASGVDRELTSTITSLEALAASQSLDHGDYGAFAREAQRVLVSQARHGWLAVNLAVPDGAALVNSLSPTGAPLPLLDVSTVKQAAAAGKPVISDLLPGDVHAQAAFSVRVPVVREGTVRYVLSAILSARSMAGALGSQENLPDRIAVLYDRRSSIVFRTVNAERLIATPVTPLLAQRSAGHEFGVIDDINHEGTPVRTVFQRLRIAGWSVAVGVPQHVLYAAQRRSIWNVLMVGAVLLALSVIVALLVARRIGRSVNDLVATADALSAPVDTRVATDTPITELARLGHTLVVAGRLIRERGASLERQVAELRVAREAAEAGNRAKDEFLALLSHELRTPLNAVYGWARMLRDGQVGAEASPRALDAIVRNANAQVQLIDDLLDVSRVITGKMRLDVQSVDLKAVVENALDAVRPAAEGKRIRLQSVLDPRAGPITGDPARLRQVVWNLLMNAVKFTDKGGRVQVHLQRINSHVEIVVSDTGRGIDPGLLPFIFDRFRQADSSSTRTHGGLGLGLALVKHLVELHGGAVVAQSGGDGKGATFIVKLPLSLAAIIEGSVARVHPTAATVESVSAGVRLDELQVLVVDDDPDAVELAMAILTGAGAVVRTCGTAREALATLQQWRPDVLVSDIEMPGEDGYTLIRKVRALDPDRGGKTPAVALTAYGRTQDRMLSLTAGYNMHVPKPVDPGELTMIIASVAGRSLE